MPWTKFIVSGSDAELRQLSVDTTVTASAALLYDGITVQSASVDILDSTIPYYINLGNSIDQVSISGSDVLINVGGYVKYRQTPDELYIGSVDGDLIIYTNGSSGSVGSVTRNAGNGYTEWTTEASTINVTSSYANNSTSASYALTASYALNGGGGGGGGDSFTEDVTFTSHGLSVGDVIKVITSSDNEYEVAQADSDDNAEVVGVVTAVSDVNNFTYQFTGIIDNASVVPSYDANTTVWLSPTTAGAMTDQKPTGSNEVRKPLGVVIEAGQKMIWLNYRGSINASGSLGSGGGGGASELSDLSDVNTSTPTNRNVLVADGGDWESRALVEADISDFGSYADASHTHAATDVTSGQFADARIQESNVTQHQGALSISGSQLVQFEEEKSFTVESPSATEDIGLWRTPRNITLTEVYTVSSGSTPSLTYTIRHNSDRSATGTEVVTGGSTTTSTSTGDSVKTFNDATIPSGSWIWLETTAQSGTINSTTFTIYYTRD